MNQRKYNNLAILVGLQLLLTFFEAPAWGVCNSFNGKGRPYTCNGLNPVAIKDCGDPAAGPQAINEINMVCTLVRKKVSKLMHIIIDNKCPSTVETLNFPAGTELEDAATMVNRPMAVAMDQQFKQMEENLNFYSCTRDYGTKANPRYMNKWATVVPNSEPSLSEDIMTMPNGDTEVVFSYTFQGAYNAEWSQLHYFD